MNRVPGNIAGPIVISIMLIVLGCSIYRDFYLAKDFIGDLRNRVVGARLIRDGQSPYFYKWKASDDVRTYDPQNFNNLKVSNVTASPFFLHLFDPIAELPQWKIDNYWCAIQYLMLAAMTVMAVLLAETNMQRWSCLLFSTLFLLTDAWKSLILWGQYYLCIPFIAMVIYFIFKKSRRSFWLFFAGTASIVLVLIRPNAVFFFIPFVFLLRRFGRSGLLAFFIPILLLSAWTLGNKEERFLWQDYVRSLGEQVKVHQNLHPTIQDNVRDPAYAEWEGIERATQIANYHKPPVAFDSENGNIFHLLNIVFHWRIPVNVLLGALLAIVLSVTGIYYARNRRSGNFELTDTILLGYGLYMLADIFSPIFRTQHYTVQCFFPVLVIAGIYKPSEKWALLLLLTGILLNISRIHFIKMEHTIGEYLIIGVVILFSLSRNHDTDKELHDTAKELRNI